MLATTILTSTGVWVPIAGFCRSTQYFKVYFNAGRVKSFIDDSILELGTVSMRVAFVLRSAEVQPTFLDLCGSAWRVGETFLACCCASV